MKSRSRKRLYYALVKKDIATYESAPRVGDTVRGVRRDGLVIGDTNSAPNNTFSVGISMSNAGTFVTSDGPNLT